MALYGIISAVGRSRSTPSAPRKVDRLLNGAVVAYFATLIVIMAAFDPSTHRSDSVHQTYGACHVEAKDISGNVRYAFLCAQDFDEDFSFGCLEHLPAEGSRWYTVCGRAHTNFGRWMAGVAGLGVFGAILYSYLLGSLRRRPAT